MKKLLFFLVMGILVSCNKDVSNDKCIKRVEFKKEKSKKEETFKIEITYNNGDKDTVECLNGTSYDHLNTCPSFKDKNGIRYFNFRKTRGI